LRPGGPTYLAQGGSPVLCLQSTAIPPRLPQRNSPMKRLLSALASGILFLAVASPAAAQKDPPVQDTVTFEKGSEYRNPDNQHLQLNMARPKVGDGPFPCVLCIHGGGFRAG